MTPTPATRIAAVLAIGAMAFLAGFSASSSYRGEPVEEPIVNVNAWQETAPPKPVQLSALRIPACNPWDVSEVAMEEILSEMMQRGWRPPRQGDAIESLAFMGVAGIEAVDPYAPMPRRGGESVITVLSEEEAEQFYLDQEGVALAPPPDVELLPPPS